MDNPWERHLSAAVLLVSVAVVTGEFWNAFAGAAIAAAAFFVAMRPLFCSDPVAGRRELVAYGA